MKKIIFTVLLMACFAISQNGFSQSTWATLPQMDQDCLAPNANGIMYVAVYAQFPQVVNKFGQISYGIGDGNWSVTISPIDPTQTAFLPKSDFVEISGGLYRYRGNGRYHRVTINP